GGLYSATHQSGPPSTNVRAVSPPVSPLLLLFPPLFVLKEVPLVNSPVFLEVVHNEHSAHALFYAGVNGVIHCSISTSAATAAIACQKSGAGCQGAANDVIGCAGCKRSI